MKFNPLKCAFGMESGRFLDFLVSEWGIEASPEKFSVIMNMPHPQNINEVQRLAERVATLSRFISCSTNKCLPFFKVLRKVQDWDVECSQAFYKLKKYLTHSPLLS